MSRLHDFGTTARVKLALVMNPNIGGLDIAVETVNDIVVLTGYVQDPAQKNLAAEIAHTNGGIDVKNDVRILSEVVEPESLIRTVARQPEEMTPEELSIRDRILGNLEADGRVNSMMVNVDEAGGTVRLSGIQESETARIRAEEIAARVAGVTQVINEIEVEARSQRRAA